jgi:hypothetical protein
MRDMALVLAEEICEPIYQSASEDVAPTPWRRGDRGCPAPRDRAGRVAVDEVAYGPLCDPRRDRTERFGHGRPGGTRGRRRQSRDKCRGCLADPERLPPCLSQRQPVAIRGHRRAWHPHTSPGSNSIDRILYATMVLCVLRPSVPAVGTPEICATCWARIGVRDAG